MELVSVVITTYKRKRELDRALQSVINQTYGSIEIIVVDDNIDNNVSDEVRDILKKYSDKANIIYKKNEKNLGGALSRNEGLKLATGKYIAFLDDDDEYLPSKIEAQVRHFEISKFHNLGLVYCFTEAVNESGKRIQVYENRVNGNFVYESMLSTIAATTQWLCLREAVESIGGFRDVPCKQDTTLLIDLALAGFEIDFVPQVLCKYYESPIERISGFGRKRINGELLLRKHIRENYSILSSQEIDEIEYAHGFILYDLFINNYLVQEAKRECKELMSRNYSFKRKIKLITYLPGTFLRRVVSDGCKRIKNKNAKYFV